MRILERDGQHRGDVFFARPWTASALGRSVRDVKGVVIVRILAAVLVEMMTGSAKLAAVAFIVVIAVAVLAIVGEFRRQK